jgi:hypothetical protein
MNANLARHMSDRPGGVHHQPSGFFLKLRGILLPLFRHLIRSFPVKILLDPMSGKFRAPQSTLSRPAGRGAIFRQGSQPRNNRALNLPVATTTESAGWRLAKSD